MRVQSIVDPVFQAFREQCALLAICAFNEAPHPILPQSRENLTARIKSGDVFLHSLGQSRRDWLRATIGPRPLRPESDHSRHESEMARRAKIGHPALSFQSAPRRVL